VTRTAAVVCGAGISSTFLARAIRRALDERSADWALDPLALDQLLAAAPHLDHVVIGHHLADDAPAIAAALALHGVRATLLRTPGTGEDAAREAADHLTAALAEFSGGPRG
jgi:cellobiose PTS system EIIB component